MLATVAVNWTTFAHHVASLSHWGPEGHCCPMHQLRRRAPRLDQPGVPPVHSQHPEEELAFAQYLSAASSEQVPGAGAAAELTQNVAECPGCPEAEPGSGPPSASQQQPTAD